MRDMDWQLFIMAKLTLIKMIFPMVFIRSFIQKPATS